MTYKFKMIWMIKTIECTISAKNNDKYSNARDKKIHSYNYMNQSFTILFLKPSMIMTGSLNYVM